jgi:hypothetical protein
VNISQIAHVSQKGLEKYLARLLPTENDSLTEQHLSTCKSCVARLTHWTDFSATLHALSTRGGESHEEKRRDPTFPTNGTGILQLLNPFFIEQLQVHISDVSKNGMGLNVAVPINQGSIVKVKVNELIVFGEARYSKIAAEGFAVGIQLFDFSASILTSF